MAPVEGLLVMSNEKSNRILFNQSKNELFKLNDSFKVLQRKLKGTWRIGVNNDEISMEVLVGVSVFVLAGSQEKFTENEFNVLKKYLELGGSILVLLAEGGEKVFQTNINFLLEEYGIMINNDCVVRTHYYKYFHPKECFIINANVNKTVLSALGKEFKENNRSLSFIYPYGATLNVVSPASAVLTTGTVAFPINRPIMAFVTHPSVYNNNNSQGQSLNGKIAVMGSAHILANKYLEKEDNDKICEMIFTFLTSPTINLDVSDTEELEIVDYTMVPDVGLLAEKPRGCIQESFEDIPMDYTQLLDQKLYSVNMDAVPAMLDAYKALNVKHEPLRLIPPQFETPLPPLQAAVFPPSFRDLPPPPLELFDLEEAFSSERARLSQLANKCLTTNSHGRKTLSGGRSMLHNEEVSDVEYFVREAGHILGLTTPAQNDAAKILHSVVLQIADFKKNIGISNG
ncbi:intraflagellar transport 52 isoform X2 [Lycorma delicatula]|uniref:intraflagellar transport 52 isoform X2 n=1 Tax=Lycorma delicatula TaxID=130591 RepID=UPI003F519837